MSGYHQCRGCGEGLSADRVHFRFAVVVQGEQAALGGSGGGGAEDDALALLARIEAEGDWERYEEEVHWEAQGVLCPACRERLVALLGARQESPVH